MNLDDIRKIMEGSTIEFKEAIVESVFKTLSAFANTNGGIVYIGISDRKEIKGFHCQNSTIEDLTNKIVNKLGIHPQIDSIDVDDKNILKIETKKSTLPVSYDGRYYKRVGNTTREMQGEELRAFFIKGTNWDGLTGDYSVEEIDAETVRKFVRMAVRSGRLKKADEDDDIKTTLEKLKLVIDGKLTNGAIMLFGKIPQNRFINAVVRVGRFKDEITIIGDRYIEGNLFKQVDESLESIKNFINVRYEITGETLTRENIWDYPLEALRESLLNSVIHRDYFRYNVQTQIKIFNDWIWFFNIGGLPEGITLEQLKTTHPSVARNPLIVHIFYLAGLIEE
jgi:ATP-dependent DNA helicase RecG